MGYDHEADIVRMEEMARLQRKKEAEKFKKWRDKLIQKEHHPAKEGDPPLVNYHTHAFDAEKALTQGESDAFLLAKHTKLTPHVIFSPRVISGYHRRKVGKLVQRYVDTSIGLAEKVPSQATPEKDKNLDREWSDAGAGATHLRFGLEKMGQGPLLRRIDRALLVRKILNKQRSA